MGGKDDDPWNDLDKWVESQRAEITKLRDELLRDNHDNDQRTWTNDASSSPLKGPFERFKSFVDSNFSALSEGFKNFPSNVSELKAKMQQERDARREEEREIWRKWTGSEDSPDHIRMQVDRLSGNDREAVREATYMLLRESYERNKHVPAQKILDLYRDNEWSFGGLDQFANPMLSFGGACYYKPETVDNLPSTARWGWPAPRPQWLSVDWFKRSPYSPMSLELHPELCCAGTKWRAAFEDLLSASLDNPLQSQEKVGERIPFGKPQSTYYGPGLEWMLSLQCRGILPPQLPSLYKPVSLFDGFDEVKRPRKAQFMHDIEEILSSKSAPMYPLVKRDFNLLMDEIAIQSGPEFEARVKPVAVAPWRVPSTEQELYDSMPPFDAPEGRQVPLMTGNIYEDMSEAEYALWEAIRNNDTETAADCLSAYYNVHGNVEDLLSEPLEDLDNSRGVRRQMDWFPILGNALRRSSVPEDEYWGLVDDNGQMERSVKIDKREFLAQLEELEKKNNEQLKQAREAEKEYLKHKSRRDQTDEVKRPDILSQLTTTHTTRLPDGTVTTKVVLRQKFADGREEEHESVHTTHEQERTSEDRGSKDSNEQMKGKKKSGWFWS